MKILETRSLTREFETLQGRLPVFVDVSFSLESGRTTVLMGPNAAGKSSLVRVIGKIDRPDAGEVRTFPQDPTRPFMAVLIQEADETLLPWRTNLRNATFGLEVRGIGASESSAVVRDFVEKYGLPIPLAKSPDVSSGGERQMVGVARTAVVRPEIIVLDEPFSRIDPALVTKWWVFLRRFAAEERVACLVVTHNVVEAAALADDVLVLAPQYKGGGSVIARRIEAPPRSTTTLADRSTTAELIRTISEALESVYAS